jgi:hypothetical protein
MIAFDDFQKIAEILIEVRSKVNLDTDVVWSEYDNPQQLLDALAKDIQNLHACDSMTLSKVYLQFSATGTYQELSISNGWGDEYLELSRQFDHYHKKIRSVLPAT